ncbi:hypothetical protein [Haliangium ochraceum]|nr:hypothetical protein [Haliangium ochraceum]
MLGGKGRAFATNAGERRPGKVPGTELARLPGMMMTRIRDWTRFSLHVSLAAALSLGSMAACDDTAKAVDQEASEEAREMEADMDQAARDTEQAMDNAERAAEQAAEDVEREVDEADKALADEIREE